MPIGPGFAAWISAHQATPIGVEEFHYDDIGQLAYSTMLVIVGNADGVTKDIVQLVYVPSLGVRAYPFRQPV